MNTATSTSAALTGKTAIVTGAASGIGRASALEFAGRGANVMAVDLQEDELHALVEEAGPLPGDVAIHVCDVSDSTSVAEMVARTVAEFGVLDYAHNNAGIEQPHHLAADIPEEVFDRVLRVNLKSVWLCMAAEIKQMELRGEGAIVNTSSVGGLVGVRNTAAYGATKHGVVGLTRAAAMDYAPTGLRINAVCPGVVRTGLLERRIADDPAIEARYEAAHPMQRLARPDEIARAVVWLCSDEASFVTGQALAVDGGYTVW